jgi:hypothetical protein
MNNFLNTKSRGDIKKGELQYRIRICKKLKKFSRRKRNAESLRTNI